MEQTRIDIIIQKAEKIDLDKILEIQKKAYEMYIGWLSPEQLPPLNETREEVIKDFNEKEILVAMYDNSIAGSIRYGIKTGVCFIEKLSVEPKYQKNGIGKKLICEVEKQVKGQAHKIYLETGLLAGNLMRFYTELGYSGEAVLKNHYGKFDWVVFSKFPGTDDIPLPDTGGKK